MGKIEGINIKNYGVLKDITLGKLDLDQSKKPLGNLVTIIGASGTGKSTIADALLFIVECLESGVEDACSLRGGFDQLVSQNAKEPIRFELLYREKENAEPIYYCFIIALDGKKRPYIQSESLIEYSINGEISLADRSTNAGKILYTNDTKNLDIVNGRKLGISKYDEHDFPEITKFLNFLKSWYLCYFSPDSARREQFFTPQTLLNRNGSNINNVAQYMYRENPETFERVLKDIQSKIRGIRKIEPFKTEDDRILLRFWEEGFEKPFYSSKMSDGTLKLFAYYLLLHELAPRELIFIEEPENGLYHHYLTDLASELRKNVGTGYNKQLFVTTHSPFFVNALLPEDVWVLEKGDDGFSTIKQASEYPLVKEMTAEEVPLGDLWFSKYFG